MCNNNDCSNIKNESGVFWKEYLLQTRKEIDLEKTEGTRILHLKILLIGALLLLVKGTTGIFAFIFLPIAMFSLDRMQKSRLDYIQQRWKHLNNDVVPILKAQYNASGVSFFEEEVVQRIETKFYVSTEAYVRTLLFLPALAAATFSASILVLSIVENVHLAYTVGIVWLLLLTSLSYINFGVYSTRSTLTTSGIIICICLYDFFAQQGQYLVDFSDFIFRA